MDGTFKSNPNCSPNYTLQRLVQEMTQVEPSVDMLKSIAQGYGKNPSGPAQLLVGKGNTHPVKVAASQQPHSYT